MRLVHVCSKQRQDIRLTCTVKLSFWEKLKGLLGTNFTADPVLLVGCDSVHTAGMRYPIDICFCDLEGRVLMSHKAVPPWRLVSCRGAYFVLERPAHQHEFWFEVGETIAGLYKEQR